MIWTAKSAAALARTDCYDCRGAGLLAPRSSNPVPCACVCRRVFRACHWRFRQCAAADSFARTVAYREMPRGVDRHMVWFRHNEDYCADFEAAAKRALLPDSPDLWRIFRLFHLLGASTRLIAARLGTTRRHVFRHVSDVEAAVGRELAMMRPYSLYPPRAYLRSGVLPGAA